MDNNLLKKKPPVKIILLVISGILLIILAGYFIFTKTQKGKIITPLPAPLPTPAPKFSIPCPGDPSFCEKAQEVTKNEKYSGLGAKVPANTPVYAPFDSVLSSSRAILFDPDSKIKPFVQIILKADDSTLPLAVYAIHPTAKGGISKTAFKKGEIIATVSAEPLTYLVIIT